MFQALLGSIAPALGQEALARATLLINHVLAAEPQALARLAPHAGRSITVEWRQWPRLLPPLPPLRWQISRAGMLDADEPWSGGAPEGLAATVASDGALPGDGLVVTLDAQELGGWLLAARGGRPPMDIRGDAEFATQVGWLAENLRWDIEDDLARLIGEVPARQLARLGGLFSATLRQLLQTLRRSS
jgi:ubiquinone biosynthesis protein UbiJ